MDGINSWPVLISSGVNSETLPFNFFVTNYAPSVWTCLHVTLGKKIVINEYVRVIWNTATSPVLRQYKST